MCDTGGGGAGEVRGVPVPGRAWSRRRFLAAAAGAAFALASASRGVLDAAARPAARGASARPAPRLDAAINNPELDGLRHIAWVWQFGEDDDRHGVRDALAAHGLAVAVKTHDGVHWMSEFDPSPDAVGGPQQAAELAAFFEEGGVQFHAWYNARGVDPLTEARMASDVLDAGARSLFIDLESHAGFWEGTPEAARTLGEELRRLQPGAWLSTSIDPRPWEIGRIPLAEFAAFTDEISPQIYWGHYRDWGNLLRFREEGFDPGGVAGITPRFVLETAMRRLAAFGLPIHPVGDGTTLADDGWAEFLDESFARSAEVVSVWRVGVADAGVLRLLGETPPQGPSYAIRPGDNLIDLAAAWGVTLEELIAANGIADPNRIYVGQRLAIPRRGSGRRDIVTPPPAPPDDSPYAVQPGDNLSTLAERWGVEVAAIVEANGLADANSIYVGQPLAIPGRGAARPHGGSYVVQPGDTLTALAAEWDTTVEAIAEANALADAGSIRIGDTLRVP